jgi:hypothetical protein
MVLRSKKIITVGLLVCLAPIVLSAQSLSLTVRPHNEEIYFPDSEIELYITIRNDTAETHRFRLADDREFNLEFDMRDATNVPIETEPHGTTTDVMNQVYYRTVSLEPGDHFSFVETLNDYVPSFEPGIYTLSIRFFPELRAVPKQTPLISNPLVISIRPGETMEVRAEERFRVIAEERLRREQLPPDETVRYMIEARREANWERFFLYLNIEKLFRQSDERDRRFVRGASEAEQRRMLADYREELRAASDPTDTALTVVPDSYEIIETYYTPTDGSVVAVLSFDHDRYRERKRYTYDLERRNGFWEIIGYTVSNLPNEALTR